MANDELTTIVTLLKQLKPELQERYSVSYLGVFGSYVRHEQHAHSDVDVLVDVAQAVSLFDLIRMEEDIAKAIGREVDLVMKSALKKRIGQHILSEVIEV